MYIYNDREHVPKIIIKDIKKESDKKTFVTLIFKNNTPYIL